MYTITQPCFRNIFKKAWKETDQMQTAAVLLD